MYSKSSRYELSGGVSSPSLNSPLLRSEGGAGQNTTSRPMVSVVITTYNDQQFLPDAIESALAQTVPPAEVIVVDDGSNEDPGVVVGRYSDVKLIWQPNQGLAAARNTGWRAARGRYVVFLDADDRLMPEALATNLDRFDQRSDCGFVYGGFRYIDADGRYLPTPPPKLVGEDAYASFLRDNCVAMHATVMYRRDCLEEAGGFDARLRRCEDYELYLRLARRYPVTAGVEPIAEYRRHGGNTSLNYPLMLDTLLGVLRRQSPHIGDDMRWNSAVKTGIREWKSVYAEVQIDHALAMVKASGLGKIPWRATLRMFGLAPAAFARIAGQRALKVLRARLSPVRHKSIRFGDLRRLRPISPNFGYDRGKPVDRRYIESFLSDNAAYIKGRVLEVADNAYTMQYGGARVMRSDVLDIDESNPRATLVGDLTEGEKMPSEAFDCIVLTQTLQFVFNIHKAVATLHRILKPGGVLLLTVPGVTSIDRGQWGASWYWSLSPVAVSRLLEEQFGGANTDVTTYGNVLAAVAFLYGLAEDELRPAELDARDPQYPVIVAARAVKRSGTEHERAAKA
jgi:glycosyltransferase involved in cell wall biosynthesis